MFARRIALHKINCPSGRGSLVPGFLELPVIGSPGSGALRPRRFSLETAGNARPDLVCQERGKPLAVRQEFPSLPRFASAPRRFAPRRGVKAVGESRHSSATRVQCCCLPVCVVVMRFLSLANASPVPRIFARILRIWGGAGATSPLLDKSSTDSTLNSLLPRWFPLRRARRSESRLR